MITRPYYERFTSNEIDLSQLIEVIKLFVGNIFYHDQNLIPSALSDRLLLAYNARIDSGASLLLGYKSGAAKENQLYLEGFALRLAFTNPAELEALLDFQVATYFKSNWEKFAPLVQKIIGSHTNWFPKASQLEVDIENYLKEKIGEYHVDKEESERKGLTIAQSVLALMIIDSVNTISFSQTQKPFQDFIEALTNGNNRNIGDFMKKFKNNKGSRLHKSKKKSLDDYETVRNFFKKMKNEKCLQFIDSQIDEIKRQKNSI